MDIQIEKNTGKADNMIDLGVYDAMRGTPTSGNGFWELQEKKRALRAKILKNLGYSHVVDIPENEWPVFEKLYTDSLKKLK